MALYKRQDIWWLSINHQGNRVRKTTETSNKAEAQQLHDKVKVELWKTVKLDQKPDYLWTDAVVRWLAEAQHKRSILNDKMHLRWLDVHLRKLPLNKISRDLIEKIALAKESEGVKPATVNRLLEIVRAILRKAEKEWGWIYHRGWGRIKLIA